MQSLEERLPQSTGQVKESQSGIPDDNIKTLCKHSLPNYTPTYVMWKAEILNASTAKVIGGLLLSKFILKTLKIE